MKRDTKRVRVKNSAAQTVNQTTNQALKGEVKGILQWSEAELERFRATDFLSMMCESSDLLAKASRDRAAKEKGVRRRGLLARARWRERSAALARKVMKSENLAEDVYEYVRFQDADTALQRLHHNSSELEGFRLEGLAIEEVKRWLEYKDRALCQWLRGRRQWADAAAGKGDAR
jgi:hypothetical protein